MEVVLSGGSIKSVTVVIFNDGKVLLVKNGASSDHPMGVYGLPAGKVDWGEDWEEAAIRECEEESGLKPIKLIRLPTFYEAELPRKDGTTKKFCCWSYLCTEYVGTLRATTETEPVWVKVGEISKLPMVVNVDRMIFEAQAERDRETKLSDDDKLRNLIKMQSCGLEGNPDCATHTGTS